MKDGVCRAPWGRSHTQTRSLRGGRVPCQHEGRTGLGKRWHTVTQAQGAHEGTQQDNQEGSHTEPETRARLHARTSLLSCVRQGIRAAPRPHGGFDVYTWTLHHNATTWGKESLMFLKRNKLE